MITVGPFIRQALIELAVDDVVRFPRTHRSVIHAQMSDLKKFGHNGKRYNYGTIRDLHKDEIVVVRIV